MPVSSAAAGDLFWSFTCSVEQIALSATPVIHYGWAANTENTVAFVARLDSVSMAAENSLQVAPNDVPHLTNPRAWLHPSHDTQPDFDV